MKHEKSNQDIEFRKKYIFLFMIFITSVTASLVS